MSSIGSLNGTQAKGVVAGASAGPSANASGELAKCESQLSDWVNCPSSKTAAGKAKIAEITGKIESIKARMKNAEEAKALASAPSPTQELRGQAAQVFRFDSLGSWLNAQA